MPAKTAETPSADARFEARKREIAKRNEKAFAKGRERRDAASAAALARRRTADELDRSELPTQPSPAA